jgi:hypothetical protein
MNDTIHSYSSPLAVGHAHARSLFDGPVVVEEKIDGSQFSFCRAEDGTLSARSRGQQLVLDAPNAMFERAVETVRTIANDLVPGWIYRGEYLQKPKHNTLAYERTPAQYFILFDVETSLYAFLSPDAKRAEGERLGLETVPLLHHGEITSAQQAMDLVPATSVLGGAAEGVVIKNYAQLGSDKKVLMGKIVTDTFKEKHGVEWKKSNPAKQDVVELLIQSLRTDARWQKAVQHLRENGTLTSTPQDIGALLKEVQADVERDSVDEIKDALYRWALPHIRRGVTNGLPEWYKAQLMAEAFDRAA